MTADNQTTAERCHKDGGPCYVGAGTDDAHWRCGTSACGNAKTSDQSQTTALKSCPFCGLSPLRNVFFAWCRGKDGEPHMLVQQPVDLWNRRICTDA